MIETITNIEQIKKEGNLLKVDGEKIQAHLPAAKADVIDVIGADKYSEIAALEDEDEVKILAGSGEAKMALCYILPAINLVSSGMGVTRSTGFQDNRVDNLSETELQNMIERLKRDAIKILSRFIVVNADAPSGICNTGLIKMAAI